MKKYYKTGAIMLCIALFTALLLYPLLHEAGHGITAALTGARITDFRLLPVPYICCETESAAVAPMAAIGLSGLLFPGLTAILLPGNSLYIKEIRLLLKGITALAGIISFVSVKCGCNRQDDFYRMAQLWQCGARWLEVIALTVFLLFCLLIWLECPIKWLKAIFDLPD